jgi:DNA-3-methyladenine glycosylase I
MCSTVSVLAPGANAYNRGMPLAKLTSANRCPWPAEDALMIAYHDEEWGAVQRDGRALYANLVLDGFQAGLSWRTILHKRPAFYRAFDGFEPAKVARYGPRQVERLLGDSGIVRNRAKIAAAITNAQAVLQLEQQPGGFSDFCWSFVGGKPLVNHWTECSQIPAASPEAEALSKALKAAGFKFVGPTIVYAFMQACGLVNDHLVTCPRWKELQKKR